MRHFELADWVDYARGLAPAAVTPDMRAHLDAGCQVCAERLRMFTEIGEVLRRDAACQPPDDLVRWARALASTRRPAEAPRARPRLATLVFDSLRDPLPAGVRAVDPGVSRHVLYAAAQFGLDLRLERERGAPTVTLIGQLVDTSRPAADLSRVRVVVRLAATEIASAVCSRFGEFEVSYTPRRGLRLYVDGGAASEPVAIALDELRVPPAPDDTLPPRTPHKP